MNHHAYKVPISINDAGDAIGGGVRGSATAVWLIRIGDAAGASDVLPDFGQREHVLKLARGTLANTPPSSAGNICSTN